MRSSVAIAAAQKYAEEWDVKWGRVIEIKDRTAWWKFFSTTDFTITVETDCVKGEVDVTSPGDITRFEVHPTNSSDPMVPLWAAFPTYNAVTIGWRMGNGELYRAYWNSWFESLDETQRAKYKTRFPPPEDPDLAWINFYEYFEEARRGEQT